MYIIFLNKLKNEDLPSFAASVEIADVVLAGDGDSAIFAVLVVAGRRNLYGLIGSRKERRQQRPREQRR